MSNKAKIFLSSGQKTTQELAAAKAVKEKLADLGFDVFRAAEVETPRELLEVIYPALQDADYLVFLDFSRESLRDSTSKTSSCDVQRRGSLYCHQEFAIAGFLGLESSSFRQNGVEYPSGMSSTMMGNCAWFENFEELPNLVHDVVKKKIDDKLWSTSTRNSLRLSLSALPTREHPTINGETMTWDYYHAQVTNLHHRKRATNCYAYLDKLVVDRVSRQHRRAELKWRGVQLPSVSIWNSNKESQDSASTREFDAFVIELGGRHGRNQLVFKSLTDAPNFNPDPIFGAAEIEATFIVCSDQFPDAKQTFRFSYDGNLSITMH